MAFGLLLLSLLVFIHDSTSEKLHVPDQEGSNGLVQQLESKYLNVLLMTTPSIGHLTPSLALAEELVNRGHNVTLCIGVDSDKYKDIIEDSGAKYCHTEDSFMQKIGTPSLSFLTESLARYSKKLLLYLNPSLSDGLYDVVIGTEFLSGLLSCIDYQWNIPAIVLGTSSQHSLHLHPPWSWPSVLHGHASDDLTFLSRMLSVVEKTFYPLFYYYFYSPTKVALEDYCPSISMKRLSSSAGVHIPYIVPIVMGFEYPRTLSPMSEYVGPLLPPSSPLPITGDLKEWLESKPDKSVVYISTGSRFFFDKETGRAILEGVMKTNLSILWSLKKSNQWILDGVELDSNGVYISEWTPQFSVLGSRAIHSAILHGGFNGLNEALWNGVPVIGFPLMFEQVANIARLHFNGIGIRLDSKTLTDSIVADAITSLDRGEYRFKIKAIQKMFRLAGGTKRAADLVEFYEDVGYDHLVPAYAKYQWSWVQYYNADVYTSLIVLMMFILLIIVSCCKLVYKKCSCSKKKIE